MTVEAVTPELISDDPRKAVEDGPMAEAKRFVAFIKRGGGLTVGQLAKCAEVDPGTVSSMCRRGRPKSEHYFDTRWIPLDECRSYIAMHMSGERMAGGRGMKAPSIKEMWKATVKDVGI